MFKKLDCFTNFCAANNCKVPLSTTPVDFGQLVSVLKYFNALLHELVNFEITLHAIG
jgi:hypothetical protein